jgi:hypothetical protein
MNPTLLNTTPIKKTVKFSLNVSKTPIVMLERLVGAIISNIQPRSPLWFHDELEKAAKQGWILSSSEVEALIGVKPKGEIFHRGGWEFVRAGKIGNQGAWKVNKLEL